LTTPTEYCTPKLNRLFSQERETAWDELRVKCNDADLNQADRNLYYDHLRAVMLELMAIAITKNCGMKASMDARIFIDNYIKQRGWTQVGSLATEYNAAFGSSYTDGVRQIVQLFSRKLTQSKMGEFTKQQFYEEFYTILNVLFEEFKTVKLVETR
jgi:hypothetical protein